MTIDLESNCDEGVARIMIVQIAVQYVSKVVVKFIGSGGSVLPDGEKTVSSQV